jgi:hypothetical protein
MEKPDPFILQVVQLPPSQPPWDDDELDDEHPYAEVEQLRYLFRGRPEPFIVHGSPVSEEDMRFFLGEWRDGARPPEPSPLVREAWQDLSAWPGEWRERGGAPSHNAPKGSDGATLDTNREAPSFGAAAPRMSCEEANAKAMELAKADPSFVQRPLREWADAIGCSEGLVAKLTLWRATMKRTGRGKEDTGPAPKVVSLTDGLDAVTGAGDRNEVLEQLIAEQEADREPSPLEDDQPGSRPRKVHSRKRL